MREVRNQDGTVTVRVVRCWGRAWRGGGSPAGRDALVTARGPELLCHRAPLGEVQGLKVGGTAGRCGEQPADGFSGSTAAFLKV